MDGSDNDPLARARADWVNRVLGIRLPGSTASEPGNGTDIVGLWWDTKDHVDGQLEALRRVFLATGHPLARAATEIGLGLFSGGQLVRFQAAVINRRNAAPEKIADAAAALKRQADVLSGFVGSNRMLGILEKNPFGVPVTIRRDVTLAMARIVALAGPDDGRTDRGGSA